MRQLLYVGLLTLSACGTLEPPTELRPGEYFRTEECSCNHWEWIRVEEGKEITFYHQLGWQCWEFHKQYYQLEDWNNIFLKPYWRASQGVCDNPVNAVMGGEQTSHGLEMGDNWFKIDDCKYQRR